MTPASRANGPSASAAALLSIENLHVQFDTSVGVVRAVEGLTYAIRPGEIVAVVGESGSGKSVSALATMRLLPRRTARVRGRILFDGRDLLTLNDEEMRRVRGRQISMIFQEPMTSLNPILPIGLQITEPLQIHLGMSDEQARARAVELMRMVGIPDPERRLDQYPHQFSGGMRQRVMIAIGLACNPKLIIADEPTTALDVTIQAQILELMKDLARKLNIALIIITHNLGIVARYADRVIVMYAGRLVEQGPADAIFQRPRHPYTMGLLRSVPRLDRPRGAKLETIEGSPPPRRAVASRRAAPTSCRRARTIRRWFRPTPAACRRAFARPKSRLEKSAGPRQAERRLLPWPGCGRSRCCRCDISPSTIRCGAPSAAPRVSSAPPRT
jgi:peptide/nickel transport system ATP-binding protein